jgi:hypothetical protein
MLARAEPDPKLQKEYLDLARRWDELAHSYETADSIIGAKGTVPDDLPLNFHPAAIRASAVVTPFGAV